MTFTLSNGRLHSFFIYITKSFQFPSVLFGLDIVTIGKRSAFYSQHIPFPRKPKLFQLLLVRLMQKYIICRLTFPANENHRFPCRYDNLCLFRFLRQCILLNKHRSMAYNQLGCIIIEQLHTNAGLILIQKIDCQVICNLCFFRICQPDILGTRTRINIYRTKTILPIDLLVTGLRTNA